MGSDRLVEQQIEYYRARAGEYDEWFLREGRYDRGPEHRAEWLREVDALAAALAKAFAAADVLELACGTGLWTGKLARQNRSVHAVDSSREVLALNRERVAAANVTYEVADLFRWTPSRQFDAVFFSFWLSHVPSDRFDTFWSMVRTALQPGGSVFFVDSLFEATSTAIDHSLNHSGIVRRKLNDGREFDIVKQFYEPGELQGELRTRGWRGSVRTTGRFFLYGLVTLD